LLDNLGRRIASIPREHTANIWVGRQQSGNPSVAGWGDEERLRAQTVFNRLLAYRRAPLSCFFKPLRLPTGLLIRATNSAVVSSFFSRLGLFRTMVDRSLCWIDGNECVYIWRTSFKFSRVCIVRDGSRQECTRLLLQAYSNKRRLHRRCIRKRPSDLGSRMGLATLIPVHFPTGNGPKRSATGPPLTDGISALCR